MIMTLNLNSTDLNRFKFTEENVIQLKVRFPHLDNETLARYLIAQNDDLEGAAKKLLKAEDLKAEYWHIKKSQCINEIKTGTAYLNGFDREGRPVLVLIARLHDPVKRDLKEMIQMTLWWTEQALAKLPDHKSQFVILLDRDNCDNALDTEYLQKVAEIFQDLHPERLHKAIVYPTGLVYYSMWNLVLKWFMEENTRSKVVPAITLNDVFDLVEEKYVPVSLGGKCTYEFNPDDFSDPVYPDQLGSSPSETTLASVYSEKGGKGDEDILSPCMTEPIHSPDHNLVAQISDSTHTTSETPLPDIQSVDPDDTSDCELHIPYPTTTPSYATPEKPSYRTIEEQLAALQSETLPLDGAEDIVGEGWQEYLEYERSQHNSPTGPTTHPQAHELFSPDTVYDESSDEEEEENVWNDVDSVTSRLSFSSTQASTVRNQQPVPHSSRSHPQFSVPSSSFASNRNHLHEPAAETSVGCESRSVAGANDSASSESYHYNTSSSPAAPPHSPPAVEIADIPTQLGGGGDDEDCAGLWHEVASVAGSEDNGDDESLSPISSPSASRQTSQLSATTATSRHPFETVNRSVIETPPAAKSATAARTLHRSSSAPALLGSPKIHPTVAAYARIGTFVVFVSVAIVVVATILYSIYSPSSMAVPLTVLAQLMLLLMLLFSFL